MDREHDANYCRFCAERKIPEKLLDLENDTEKYEETTSKLHYINAAIDDVSTEITLPKTVCFICFESLNKAYEFVYKVRESQKVLSSIFHVNSDSNFDAWENDGAVNFEDFTVSELSNKDSTTIIKQENLDSTSELHEKHQEVLSLGNSSNTSSCIKLEPKEESVDATGIVSPLNKTEPSLNVEAIIGTAVGDLGTFYAKELQLELKKTVKKWKDFSWVCYNCNITCTSLEMLREHSKAIHGRCASFTCIECEEDMKYHEFDKFIEHVRKHRKSLRNVCCYCDKKVERFSEHIKQHISADQAQCTACGEILDSYELTQHLTLYNTVKKKKHRRKRGTPITIDDLTCNFCKKVYKNSNSLRDHIKRHTGDRNRNFTCEKCGKTFFNKGTLTTHCMSHEVTKPHVCKICKKSFLFPNMLRRHVDMHSGVKPFSCDQCGRCFRLKYQLNTHKIIHTDSMPYVCQYCSKAFRFKQILKSHERQHTGAKPYSCEMCAMEFTNWSNYNKHMKRRHNTDTSKKKITPEGTFPVNPETGQLVQIEDPVGTEEWKNEIMIPGKRGKKKKIKNEID